MIKRNNSKVIKGTESRIDLLRDFIVDGEDAEAVYKYAFRLKKEADEKMLEAALSYGDIERQRSDYRAVCRLIEMLQHAASTGKQKEKTLAQLQTQG